MGIVQDSLLGTMLMTMRDITKRLKTPLSTTRRPCSYSCNGALHVGARYRCQRRGELTSTPSHSQAEATLDWKADLLTSNPQLELVEVEGQNERVLLPTRHQCFD